ncbi:MAG: DUF4258 domain-containing protein [Chloroflexi bacterium]|nr:DUF4258 domain-containing protein [Chloroflexota bacterium]MBU1660841.1 DUF4258 domain-containing protein [Chloroflexota bacterium]
MRNRGLIFRIHALQRMYKRHVSRTDVRTVLETGIVIEDYPEDKPYPSQLILGWSSSRILHVVAAHNADTNEIIVITVYEPDQDKWEADFKRRKK